MNRELIETYKKNAEIAISRFEEVHFPTCFHVKMTRPDRYTRKYVSSPKAKRFQDFGSEIFELKMHNVTVDEFFKSKYVPVLFWADITNRVTTLHALKPSFNEHDQEMYEMLGLKVFYEPARKEHIEKAKKFMLEEYWKLEEDRYIKWQNEDFEPKSRE